MVKEDQYLAIDVKTKFIEMLVAKIQGVATTPRPWLEVLQKKQQRWLDED